MPVLGGSQAVVRAAAYADVHDDDLLLGGDVSGHAADDDLGLRKKEGGREGGRGGVSESLQEENKMYP